MKQLSGVFVTCCKGLAETIWGRPLLMSGGDGPVDNLTSISEQWYTFQYIIREAERVSTASFTYVPQ